MEAVINITSRNIKNHPAKSVLLEKLSLKAIVAVDSAKIDTRAPLNGRISEQGFYRLKLDDKPFSFSCLNFKICCCY